MERGDEWGGVGIMVMCTFPEIEREREAHLFKVDPVIADHPHLAVCRRIRDLFIHGKGGDEGLRSQ
jgi:hypothetical protein